MIELEFFGKGTELIQEGIANTKAYMIIKGEVELKSAYNLYTISM
jgi:signal-transduction protein with cAMP-binding, CBS, and nucleotidyltransferase domain